MGESDFNRLLAKLYDAWWGNRADANKPPTPDEAASAKENAAATLPLLLAGRHLSWALTLPRYGDKENGKDIVLAVVDDVLLRLEMTNGTVTLEPFFGRISDYRERADASGVTMSVKIGGEEVQWSESSVSDSGADWFVEARRFFLEHSYAADVVGSTGPADET